ncbi:MAG: ATP-binding protein [Candidatus Angelobacter sp.]
MKRNVDYQGCLFEEDFLRRTLGAVANTPDVALTELVANAWDAGATEVALSLPENVGEMLTIEDDGTGMLPSDFRKKWMTLGYDRIRNQGVLAEFPPERKSWKRPAYGRNGIGRHGMLCFASEYKVETRRAGVLSIFTVSTAVGKDPFELVNEESRKARGHGTKLVARVTRNLPSAERIRGVLAARFLHDPQFIVKVNGKSVPLAWIIHEISSQERKDALKG